MRGIWGILGRSGGGDNDDRHAPSGRGSRPSLQDDKRNQLSHLFRFCDSNEVVDRDQSAWYGCDDSGWSLLEQDAIKRVWGSGGVGRDCGGRDILYSSQQSVTKPDCEDEGYRDESGAGYSKRNGNCPGVVVLHKTLCEKGRKSFELIVNLMF